MKIFGLIISIGANDKTPTTASVVRKMTHEQQCSIEKPCCESAESLIERTPVHNNATAAIPTDGKTFEKWCETLPTRFVGSVTALELVEIAKEASLLPYMVPMVQDKSYGIRARWERVWKDGKLIGIEEKVDWDGEWTTHPLYDLFCSNDSKSHGTGYGQRAMEYVCMTALKRAVNKTGGLNNAPLPEAVVSLPIPNWVGASISTYADLGENYSVFPTSTLMWESEAAEAAQEFAMGLQKMADEAKKLADSLVLKQGTKPE